MKPVHRLQIRSIVHN